MKISVADISAPIGASVFKFCVHLQEATYCLSVPLFIHFSFSPMKISVADISAPIGASVFKFCVHLKEGKL